MSEDRRKLAAVAFTDMVGYTSLSQKDESLAIQLLEEHNLMLRSVLSRHRAREVKTIGDAFLLEFESALDAVTCAIDIQNALRERNGRVEQGRSIDVRIGVHVGDIIYHNGDIFGDTVNIASRIVTFAERGGVCISEQVYAQVRNKISYPVVKMSETKLKNVEFDMNLYRLVLPGESEVSPEEIKNPPSTKNRLAVIPFANISPDPRDSYFADGLTEEIISELSGIRGLRVIAGASVKRYKNTRKGIGQVGKELQVSFVLMGSVRKAGSKVRVTAQLIEVAAEENVWSGHYDRELDDVFLIQSEIAGQVANSLRATLLLKGAEASAESKRQTGSLTAYVAYLKGRAFLHDRSEKAIKAAGDQFQLAISEDAQYARAYAGLADIHMLLGDNLFAPVPASLEEAKVYINKAMELDPNIAEAWASLANFHVYDYKFSDAEREFRRAIELNPSYATAHHWYSSCLEILGRGRESLAEIMLAEELDPLSSSITLSAIYTCLELGRNEEAQKRVKKLSEIDSEKHLVDEGEMVYHFAQKDWEKASYYLARMKENDPSDPYLDSDLAYIYAVTGRREDALKIIEKLKGIPQSSRTKGTLIAFVYAGLNDLDECFKWLESGFESKELFFGWYRNYPLLDNVRRDPRFDKLLEKAGLLAWAH